MNNPEQVRPRPKAVLAFTLPLVGLLVLSSLAGLLHPELYGKETADWLAQTTAQDMIDLLLVVPVVTLAGLYLYRGERLAAPVWGGTMLYLVYTFLIYCFTVHFNRLFLAYTTILGLSAYGLIYYCRFAARIPILGFVPENGRRYVGGYFMVIAVLFSLLWLADVVPAVWTDQVPAAILTAGLVTNPVQVLDLSFLLPGVFVVGLLLRRNHPIGLLLAPALLIFFIQMDITIAVIFLAQRAAGTAAGLIGPVIMMALALLTLAAFLWLVRRRGTEAAAISPRPGNG